jgi:hypothetical protein
MILNIMHKYIKKLKNVHPSKLPNLLILNKLLFGLIYVHKMMLELVLLINIHVSKIVNSLSKDHLNFKKYNNKKIINHYKNQK